MSDRVHVLIFAASLGLGAILSLWAAAAPAHSARPGLVARMSIWVLYLGSIGALLVAGCAIVGWRAPFALAPILAGFFMNGVILAGVATLPDSFGRGCESRRELQQILLSSAVIRAARYLIASYFLMVGLFKWITNAELPFFLDSGYSRTFYIFICAFECACALGLMLRAITLPIVLALSVEIAGAVYTHFHNYFAKGMPSPFSNSLDAFRTLILLGYIAAVQWREPYAVTEKTRQT